MFYKSLFFIFLGFAPFFKAFAQDDTNYDAIFDDGGISTSKVLFKTDAIAMVHGDWPLIVEYLSSDQISLEAGLGVLMPYYVHDFLPLAFTENKGIANDKVGYSIQFQLKWYNEKKAPELGYWGLHYYRRAYSAIVVNELTFAFGNQRIIAKRMLFDISLGLGLRFQNSDGTQYMFDQDFPFTLILPLHVRFGSITQSHK